MTAGAAAGGCVRPGAIGAPQMQIATASMGSKRDPVNGVLSMTTARSSYCTGAPAAAPDGEGLADVGCAHGVVETDITAIAEATIKACFMTLSSQSESETTPIGGEMNRTGSAKPAFASWRLKRCYNPKATAPGSVTWAACSRLASGSFRQRAASICGLCQPLAYNNLFYGRKTNAVKLAGEMASPNGMPAVPKSVGPACRVLNCLTANNYAGML
jgi:hypothetical protein